MNPLILNLKETTKYKSILESITSNKPSNITVTGLTDSVKASQIYAITKDLSKSSIVVCSNVASATRLIQDLKFFSDIEIVFLPSKNIEYYDIDAESKEIENARMYAIDKVKSGKLNIVVTTIDAFLIKMFSNKTYDNLSINISCNSVINLTRFTEKLVSLRI
ncbi:MAG: hypothetical protein RSE00_04610 [Clostridia bacterium]